MLACLASLLLTGCGKSSSDESSTDNTNIQNTTTTNQSTDTSSDGSSNQPTKDWVVAQAIGSQILCWTLKNTDLYYGDGNKATSNQSSDTKEIYWSNSNGTMSIINGTFDMINVSNGNFQDAYNQLNLTSANCPVK